MYIVLKERMILGVDWFIRDPQLGSQFRIWFFGINIWWASGDVDSSGNGYTFTLGFPYYKDSI
jgi:hypothetical protein